MPKRKTKPTPPMHTRYELEKIKRDAITEMIRQVEAIAGESDLQDAAGKIAARKDGVRTLVDVASIKAYYAALPLKTDHAH